MNRQNEVGERDQRVEPFPDPLAVSRDLHVAPGRRDDRNRMDAEEQDQPNDEQRHGNGSGRPSWPQSSYRAEAPMLTHLTGGRPDASFVGRSSAHAAFGSDELRFIAMNGMQPAAQFTGCASGKRHRPLSTSGRAR